MDISDAITFYHIYLFDSWSGSVYNQNSVLNVANEQVTGINSIE